MRTSDTKQPENKKKPRTMHTLNYFCRPDHTILATRPSQWWLPGQQVLETCSKSLLFSIHLLIWITSLISFSNTYYGLPYPRYLAWTPTMGVWSWDFFPPFSSQNFSLAFSLGLLGIPCHFLSIESLKSSTEVQLKLSLNRFRGNPKSGF